MYSATGSNSNLLIDQDARTEMAAIRLASEVGDALHKAYPGHMWMVSTEGKGGNVLNVQNMALSGKWGFALHAHKLVDQDVGKVAVRAGGELLERYRISRSRAGVAQARDALNRRWASPTLELQADR